MSVSPLESAWVFLTSSDRRRLIRSLTASPMLREDPWVERSVLARAEAYPLPWEAASDWNCYKLAIGAEK